MTPSTAKKNSPSSDLPKDRFVNRELSWLEFNQRVLEQAGSADQPLLERLKFLAITGSNLDEFFMVRVGSLKMQAENNPGAKDVTGLSVFDQIKAVTERCRTLQRDQYNVLLDELRPDLHKIGIHNVNLQDCDDRAGAAVDRFFDDEVSAVLSPQTIDPTQPFPLLPGLQVIVCARLQPLEEAEEETDATWDYSLIPLGRVLPRIAFLPSDQGLSYALLEDVVAENIHAFFPGRQVVESQPIRLTRNADIAVREDSAADLMTGMSEVLESRKASGVVRLEISDCASEAMESFLRDRLDLELNEVYRTAGPLDLSYLFQLSGLEGFDKQRDPAWPSQPHARIDPRESMFVNMSQGDLLLVHPYEQFDPIVRLIEEAAVDPDVLAIKQVLYRTSRQSPIIAALKRAAERGKYVTAVLELKARFDEARNIEWAREMEQSGVQVIYGVKGLKTHAKVCVIVRREAQGIVRYVHFGTGNYNESTARLYSDISLLTCHDELGADASAFFNAITGASRVQQFHYLEAAPLTLRKRLLSLIDSEAARCREGQGGKIIAKLNALVDPDVIDALYRASQAGVKISLNIRGICCLKPQVPGLSDNIEVTSIIDRYLEHARIFYFAQGGEEAMFISSADWMSRNLNRRVELLVPILDSGCRKKLWNILETYFNDNTYSWRMQPDGRYVRQKPRDKKAAYRAQQKLFERAQQETSQSQMVRTASFTPHQASDTEN